LAFEGAMRSVAFEMTQRHLAAHRHAAEIHASLMMHECPGLNATAPRNQPEPPPCVDGTH
jgi:hypothetical protein